MCELDQFDYLETNGKRSALTRRQFGAVAGGTSLAMMLPPVANAQAVREQEVSITTPDGTADGYFVHPASGAHAAVLVWPDIAGLRPAFRTMYKRLGESGYSVLVVNPFYRGAKSPIVPDGSTFQQGMAVGRTHAANLNATTHASDAKAFVAWLDAQPSVSKTRKIGTTGYCMGGPIVMRTAAAVPDRIGAGASFHGGGLTTANPDSPHLGIPQMKAQFLIAVAQNDDMRDPQSKETLKTSFAAANLPAEIEVYPAQHGWCPPDSPAYDAAQADRAWTRMLALFEKALA
jgi:carboxymethylenebutenolidase